MPSPRTGRRAAALVAALAWLALAASPAGAHPPTASFEYTPAQPAPGEEVTFRSTSTGPPEHTQFLAHSWDLDGDGVFDDGNETVARGAYPEGVHTVRLRVSYLGADGTHEDTAERTITVGDPDPDPEPTPDPTPQPTPAPPGNQPPKAVLDKDCSKVGGFVFCAGLFAREGKPKTLDASPSSDPDGTIVRYEWDLGGGPEFERDTGATPTVTHTFEAYKGLIDPRKRTVRVRVTDDKGATAETAVTLALLEPSCEPVVKQGRISASGICIRPRNIEVDGKKVVRWYSERPVTLNGIRIVPAADRTVYIDLPAEAGAPAPRIGSGGAAVSVPAVQGTMVNLYNGSFAWSLVDGSHLSGFKLGSGATLNGLKITALAGVPELSSDNLSSRFALRVALPSQFGGATSDQPVVLSPGKAVASASAPLSFEVANAAIGPIGLESLKVTFDGEDLWEISTRVKLPPPIPYTVAGDAGIRAGAFEHAGAEINFGTPGIGPLGPVFLQRIAFRIEIAPKQSKCVPKVGIEYFDQRKLLHDITGQWWDVPNFEIDHGVPTFALCGEVGLTGGPTVLGAAAIRVDAGLGLATYADRPAVFRAFGKLYLVEIPIATASLELHTNGYTRARADFGWGIDGLASIEGYIMFEMMFPKFNAIAYVDACLDFVDWCAGGRAIVSSKGVAVCLKIDVLVDDWEPGFGYRWGDTFPDLYFAGCDIGDYREHISSGIDEHITAVPASLKGETSGPLAKAAGFEQAIELPAGLPGATIVARGQGAPPKLTLIGPNGERVTSPDGLRPVEQAPFFVIKDPRANLTQFAISKPGAGKWRVVVEDGSAPVVSIASANGLQEPAVDGEVTGHGARRTLSYDVEPVAGQKVTFMERGPSAGRRIGVATGRSGRIRFTPAPGRAERRRIVALVTQNGRSRGEYEVASYRAPGVRRPSRPRHLRVARRGAKLRISWRAARPADAHQVRVRLADGRRLLFRTRRSTLVVPRVKRGVRARVSVRGVLDIGLAGRAATRRAG